MVSVLVGDSSLSGDDKHIFLTRAGVSCFSSQLMDGRSTELTTGGSFTPCYTLSLSFKANNRNKNVLNTQTYQKDAFLKIFTGLVMVKLMTINQYQSITNPYPNSEAFHLKVP